MQRLAPLALLAATVGCGGPPNSSTPPTAVPVAPAAADGHTHVRGKMLIADFGPYHALLTAHLSKSGHELDLFLESADTDPKPVTLPTEALKASVQVRRADGGVREVEFWPAPAGERPPDEAAGTCSHFVAKVPWLEPDTEHRVIVEADVGGKRHTARWNSFVPRKYAHHED